MLVDKNKFLEKLNQFDQISFTENLNKNKNFSEEIINSIINDKQNTFTSINNRLTLELQNYDIISIYKSIPWFRRIFNNKVNINDINKFFTNKRNNLMSIKTDLMLLIEQTEKTVLFLDEELNNNKLQLSRIVVNLAKLTRDGEELKNVILDTSSVDDTIALELGNKKLEKLKDINDDINTLTIAKNIITQRISFILVTKRNIKTLLKSINLLINVTIPKWDETFIQELENNRLKNK